MSLTHGSLFSGLGGFDLAGDRAGLTTLWQVEIDPIARSVLARHWPDVPKPDDIQHCHGAALEPVDVITAGFPCQDLSIAGKRGGLEGARSGLFFEITRIVREMQEATDGRCPNYLVLENVPGLLSSNDGRDFAVVLGELAGLGALDISWRVCDAQYWGVPQRRRRVFVVVDFARECAASVLFEPDGLSGHPAPRREEKQTTPTGSPRSVDGRCIVTGCDKRLVARGLCANHYHRLRVRGTLEPFVPPPAKPCAVTTCGRRALKRGYCETHYQRLRTRGDVDADRPIVARADLATRFWGKVRQGDECWTWTAAVNEFGYGIFFDTEAGRSVRAHRWAYEQRVGPIPDGLHLDHLCKNKVCVRPDHLEPVTSGENTRRYYAGDVPAVAAYQATGVGYWREGIGPLAESGDNGSHQLIANAITASAGHHGHSSPRGDGSDNLIFESRVARNGRGAPEPVCPPLKAQSGQTGTGDSAPLVMGMTVRRLTPTECSRLQAYPDSWIPDTIADSHHYRLLGNSVCVAVVEWLLRRVVAAMTE